MKEMSYLILGLAYPFVVFNLIWWGICERMTYVMYREGDGSGRGPIVSSILRLSHGQRLASTVGPSFLGVLTMEFCLFSGLPIVLGIASGFVVFYMVWGATRFKPWLDSIELEEKPKDEPIPVVWVNN